uniref:Uncharacterized protein n=1 Tax=Octopus bimaculoides TaxID=37653 RepID=A0A0L8GX09_OCTBM
MIPILKACKVQCSVFGNHDFECRMRFMRFLTT